MVMSSSISIYSGCPWQGKTNKGEGLDKNWVEKDEIFFEVGIDMKGGHCKEEIQGKIIEVGLVSRNFLVRINAAATYVAISKNFILVHD